LLEYEVRTFKERGNLQAFLQSDTGEGDCIVSRVHLTEEEVYDIFRQIFHNEEDALTATIQLFGGDSWDEEEY
jgi:hypothetical protein